jgi:two-component system LytT family response regulator
VFLDIELRGGNGFDLVPLVRPEASVIFVTAYDQHAIRAFEVNALDYLLKPVEPTRLAASLERLDQTVPASTEPLEQQDLVHLQTDDGARFISANTISAIRADQNYTHVHLQDGTHHHLRRTLKSWEDQLCPAVLLRAARDALINPRHIRQAETLAPGRGGLLDLSGCPEKIPATNRHWASLQAAVRRGT